MSIELVEGVIILNKNHLEELGKRFIREAKSLEDGRVKMFPIIPIDNEGISTAPCFMFDGERMMHEGRKHGPFKSYNVNTKEYDDI